MADPSRPAGHGRSTGALAELVDLYPTLAGLAGIEGGLPPGLEGLSQVAVLDDPGSSVKDAAFTRHQQPFYGPAKNWRAWGYSIRTADWRFTEWREIGNGGVIARELYDHRNDSAETKNVVARFPAISETLAARLARQFPRAN